MLLGLLLACGEKDTGEEQTQEPEDTGTEELTPVEPEPFTITISGTDNESLLFNNPTCQIPDAAPNINIFWRNQAGSHKFVFRVMLRNEYDPEIAEYSIANNELSFTLQEEAGGEGRYYVADSNSGASGSLSLQVYEEIIGEPIVWGEAAVETMQNPSTGASITLSPSNIPVWCTPENTN